MSLTSCVACASCEIHPAEEYRGYYMATCSECGLTFTLNPDYKPERYLVSYDGGGEGALPDEHSFVYRAPAARLDLEAVSKLRVGPRLTPPETLALKWLRENAPKEALVLEIGCGSGRFLRACIRAGFQAVGVELSPRIVASLRSAGLTAIQGLAQDFPWDGPEPFALALFEVIEHLPVPKSDLIQLHDRFPRSFVIASVPSPYRPDLKIAGRRAASDYPPNHFLRWTPKALEEFFHACGYNQVKVSLPAPRGSELMPGLGQLLNRRGLSSNLTARVRQIHAENTTKRPPWWIRAFAPLALLGHRLYQVGADVVGWPRAVRARRAGATSSSMFAVASPLPGYLTRELQ